MEARRAVVIRFARNNTEEGHLAARTAGCCGADVVTAAVAVEGAIESD